MNRRNSEQPRQSRQSTLVLIGGVITSLSGCVPVEEASATETFASAAGAAMSQLLAFVSDFARQLLAAYLF